MPTKLNISQAATLYQKSRNTLYQAIKTGTLSKDLDGLIDLSELIRAYGEPKKKLNPSQCSDNTFQRSEQAQYSQQTELLAVLRRENELLRQQLEEAKERELFQRDLIQSMNQKLIPLIEHLNNDQNIPIEQLSTPSNNPDNQGLE